MKIFSYLGAAVLNILDKSLNQHIDEHCSFVTITLSCEWFLEDDLYRGRPVEVTMPVRYQGYYYVY